MKRLGSLIRSVAVVVSLAAALAACGSAPPVTVTLHRLPLGTAAAAGPAPAVQLSVPAYLDRDALLVSSGGSALVPFGEHRWAEPLAVGAARVLRHELAGRIPAANGALRVELLAFEAAPDRRTLRLAARWSGAGRAEGSAAISVPVEGGNAAALVAAHRAALAELAARIAQAA
jgi:uncharacterized lipoprotein YmbA